MTTAYTSLLGLALPVTGELSGTWGDTVNNSITSLLDTSVAGTTNVSTDADVTLTTTTGAANTARQAILLFSGARTVLRTVTAPAQSKIYTVINATTGGFAVKLVGAGPTTGVTIVAGESAVCAWNGSDFVKVSNTGGSASFTNVTVTGTTTLSGLTASTALALDASKNVVSVTNTGSGSNVLATSPTLVTPALGTPSALVGTNITGTATSFNINGTVGATTPNTGAFTTLAASGAVTLSGGTANGVPYLNGSKVLTSGSALSFSGQQFAISSLGDQIKISNSVGNQQLTLSSNAGGSVFSSHDGTNFVNMVWQSNTTPLMTLTTTGLGIATTTPAYKLDVVGTAGISGNVTLSGGTANGVAYLNGSKVVTSGSALWFDGTNFGVGTGGNSLNQQSVVYKTGANAVYQQIANGSTGLGATNGIRIGLSSAGVGEWYSPTAAISYIDNTEQMRLTSTGLGIGTSSPAAKLEVRGADAAARFRGSSIQYLDVIATSGGAVNLDANNGNAFVFSQNTAEQMRLDSSGNLGIGTSSPTQKLTVAGGNISIGAGYKLQYSSTAYITPENNVSGAEISTTGIITFLTGTGTPTERTRIDASGKVLIGTTTNNFASRLVVFNDASYTIESQRTTTASEGHMAFVNANGAVGSIFTSGTATAFNTSSDYRLKNTIAPMTGALAKVALLKPVTYKWNADGSDGQGFIAHELAEVCPDAVTGEKDAVDAQGNPQYQGIDVSFLVATLTAAIKEQQAIIESLKARLDAANL